MVAILFIVGCSDGAVTAPGPDSEGDSSPPEQSGDLIAKIQASEASVLFSEEVILEVELSGADIGDAVVTWQADGGTFSETVGAKTVWTAPSDVSTYEVVATIEVNGQSLRASAEIEVKPDPDFNYFVLHSNPTNTRHNEAGETTTTFGLEVGLSAEVIGPDAKNAQFSWELLRDGREPQALSSTSEATWTAPDQLGEARIRVTAIAGTDEFTEEIIIHVIEPLKIAKVLPENPTVGMGHTIDLEVIFDGYYKNNAVAKWTYNLSPILYPIGPGRGGIDSHFPNGKTATYRATIAEGTRSVTVSAVYFREVYDEVDIDIEVGICGAGSFTSAEEPCEIQNIYQLNAIRTSEDRMQGHYLMTGDIDASDTKAWNNGDGFVPLSHVFGSTTPGFTGTFDGGGWEIEGLYIDHLTDQENSYIGLFSAVNGGDVRNLTLSNAYIAGVAQVGAIAGIASGASFENVQIHDSEVIGFGKIGGAVGEGSAVTISNVELNRANVTGQSDHIGGIIGLADSGSVVRNSIVSDSYVFMDSSERTREFLGGVAGENRGMLNSVIVTRSEIISKGIAVGGIAGQNSEDATILASEISDSKVTRLTHHFENPIGGLVGFNYGSVRDSLVEDVDVFATNGVGGLAGINRETGKIERSIVRAPSLILSDETLPEIGFDERELAGGFVASNAGQILASAVFDPSVREAGKYVGGFVGFNSYLGVIEDSFVYGPGSIVHGAGDFVGGFAASNAGHLIRTYAILEAVTGFAEYVGGLVGNVTLRDNFRIEQSFVLADVKQLHNNYAQGNIGALIGTNTNTPDLDGNLIASYWSPDFAKSYPHSDAGKQLLATQFKNTESFDSEFWKFSGPQRSWTMPTATSPAPIAPDLINNSRY